METSQPAIKSVLIFGGLGFIGHSLALALSRNSDVHIIDNSLNRKEPHAELINRATNLEMNGVKIHNIDIFDSESVSKVLSGLSIDTAFHLAGASSVKSTYLEDGFKQVLEITNKVLNHLSSVELTRIVYFSSSMVYGNFYHDSINESHVKAPIDRYGALKYASEILVNTWAKETNTISIILRPTAVYGPFDIKHRIVAKFIDQARSNIPLTLAGDGENRLDFTYIDDVVSAAKATLYQCESNEFNISFGQSRSLNELASLIVESHPKCSIVYNQDNAHPTALRGTLNSDKAIRLLDYEPKFSLEKGLATLLEKESKLGFPCKKILSTNHQIIPLGKADIVSNDFDLINKTLQTGWFTTGPQNTVFENNFLHHLELTNSHALSVNSCTSALILALQGHEITGEVIVPAFTFSATANAVVRAGATPKFVDIESEYLAIDPIKLEESITLETQAVIVVHLAGTVCDIEKIMNIANKHKLIVIEDCAQALAAQYNGKKAGTYGDTSCYSFFPTKMITTGEGGMLVTKHPKVAAKARMLANHGYNSSTQEREQHLKPWLRKQIDTGFNFRMSNINASLGVAQLARLDDIAKTRRKKALNMIRELKCIRSIQLFEFSDRYSVYQALNILVPLDWNRDTFTLMLRKQGVMASVHYPEVLPETPVFSRYNSSSQIFPNARDISQRIVTLPLFGSITELQSQRIVEVIKSTVEELTFEASTIKSAL